ncbi:MAG TPA: cytochrome c [Burkholderiales bacterium]|nr:cytochrome c [Burkholderiales bacterium]
MLNRYGLALVLALSTASALAQGDAKRGEYVAKAGGCIGCHTEDKENAQPFAGGRALKTPFGTFYGPNITPDPNAGLGRWTEADFIRAMRFGERPDGANYFPAFPYTSFTKTTDGDLKDLWAYLRTLKPSAQPSRPHDVRFPYSWRWLVTIWKWFFFTPGPYVAAANASAMVARGGYLVDALGHCGECHTPRNFLGAMKKDRWLAGGKGPEDKYIPNLTPTHLEKQSDAELKDFLVTGTTPDGDAPAEAMAEVIRNTTSQLAPADLDALIAYLRSLPPLPEEKKEKK